MARRTRKRSRTGNRSSQATAKSGASLHAALDPLSSLLKGAGLRRSAPTEAETASPAPKPKTKKKSVPRRTASATAGLAVDFPAMPAIKGLRLATMGAGIKYQNRRDLLVATMDPGTQVAGIFTQSKMPSAPVEWCRKVLDHDKPEARVLVVHAGNANAFTGKAGEDAAKDIAASAAKTANCRQRDIFIAGTGTIGEALPTRKVTSKLSALIRGGSARPWHSAARSIMTNDTFPKGATRTAMIDGVPVTLNGIAKGSAMVAPDMATALAFIFTDAAIPSEILQALLLIGARDSFNMISVDGETSPADTVLAFATGKAVLETPITRVADRRLLDFRRKLYSLMEELALQIVRDGDGAQKLIRVGVAGAASAAAARTIAQAVATSPLVKTAIGGGHPDWGRIVVAVGKSGEAANRDKLAIRINGLPVAAGGEVDSAFSAAKVTESLKQTEVSLEIDVGVGRGSSTIWTCDLTERYITLNTTSRT